MALVATLAIGQTNAYCCGIEYTIHHVCMGLDKELQIPLHQFQGAIDQNYYWLRGDEDETELKCISRFCADGYDLSPLEFYCSVGECNVYGCNCEGGCRQHNGTGIEDLQKDWLANHDLKIVGKHRSLTNSFIPMARLGD